MQVPSKSDGQNAQQNMEERLSKVGAKIDHLIDKAAETRQKVEEKILVLKAKQKDTVKRGEEALDEIVCALDIAWHDLHQAWLDVKTGTERASEKLRHHEKQQKESDDENATYIGV